MRKDRGVKHPTSGVWHQPTIISIARNPLLRAVMQYGKRTVGDRLRFSAEGPRELDEVDQRDNRKLKVIANPESARVAAPASFQPLVDLERACRIMRHYCRIFKAS